MKLLKKFLPIVFLCSLAFANEDFSINDDEIDILDKFRMERDFNIEASKKIFVYMHYVSMYGGLLTFANNNNYVGSFFFYSTVEYLLSWSKALIVNPSIILNDGGYRIGTGIGFRHFIKDEGKGFYWQIVPSAHYMKYRNSNYLEHRNSNDELSLGTLIDVLGYIGYSFEYTGNRMKHKRMFFDIGFGYGFFYPGDPYDNLAFLIYSNRHKNMGISIDFNLGFGIF